MAKKAGVEKKKRMAAVYDLEYRKLLLAAKQEMMGKARQQAMDKLTKLDDKAYTQLMAKRLLNVRRTVQELLLFRKTKKGWIKISLQMSTNS